jgi:hypothetical protein
LILDKIVYRLPVEPKCDSQNPYLAKVIAYRSLPKTPDVLYMGSSRTWMGVIPERISERLAAEGLDVTGYNFGEPATTPLVHWMLLRDVVLPREKPRLITLDVGAREFNANNGRNDKPLRYLTRITDVPALLAERPSPNEAWTLLYSNAVPSTRRFSDVRNWIQGRENPIVEPGGDDAVKLQHADGSLEYTYTPPMTWEERRAYWDRVYTGEVLRDYEIAGLPDYCFRRFLDLARAEGIKVVLINMPVAADHMELFRNGEYDRYMEYIRKISDEYGDAVDFVDYNTPERRPPQALFHDTHHLNRAGAEYISDIIADEVIASFLEPRGEAS